VLTIHDLLELAIKNRASDLLVKAGSPPALRIDGRITITDLPSLSGDGAEEMAQSVLYTASRDYLLQFRGPNEATLQDLNVASTKMKELQQKEEIDIVFTIPDLVRVRANIFLQRSSIALALRIIPLKPFTIEELGLPPVLKDLTTHPQGLILVTGPTGSGKSTTLAAMLDHINVTCCKNIVTVEDPIEYVFQDKQCVIHQREVGRDTNSFRAALRSALRQTPDVIMVGEVRDAETMGVAMTAAEMGHLVFSTLHTNSASATINRIINAFPPHEKSQVRAQLATVLLGVISQRLARHVSGSGRVAAVEIMTTSPSVRKHIDEGNTDEIYAVVRDGLHFGMNTMNQSLEKLYQNRLVSYDEAIANAGNLAELRQLLRRS
jgi:twitching motility protein PilT